MKTTLQRWGNSQGIRIPKGIIDSLAIEVGALKPVIDQSLAKTNQNRWMNGAFTCLHAQRSLLTQVKLATVRRLAIGQTLHELKKYNPQQTNRLFSRASVVQTISGFKQWSIGLDLREDMIGEEAKSIG